MRPDLGRYFEGRELSQTNLLSVIYDFCNGQGADVAVWIDGRELVFGRGEPKVGQGFLRVLPQEIWVLIGFPRGHQLFDPKKRAKGPPRSQTRVLIRDPADFDLYVRRMVEQAYGLESTAG